jgi:hypothetical protein
VGAGTGAVDGAMEGCGDNVVATRSSLGEERLAAAWNRGQSLTLEQAIDHAYILRQPLPARPPRSTPQTQEESPVTAFN